MKMSRTWTAIAVVLLTTSVSLAASTSASAAFAVEPSAIEREVPNAQPGDQINLRRLGIFGTVPPRNQVLATSTGLATFRIRNIRGRVLVRALLVQRLVAATSQRPNARAIDNRNECSSGGYATLNDGRGPAWPGAYSWRISTVGRPSNITASQFQTAVKNAGAVWAGAKNPCGKSDVSSLTNRLLGTTSSKPDLIVRSNQTWGCGTMDGTSEIGFIRATGTSTTGLACTLWDTSDGDGDGKLDIRESDIALNSRYSWVVPGAGCSSTTRFYLDEVLTHEFGHAVGVAHGPATSHVMYPYHANCSRLGISLSLGDYNAAKFLY